jgi:hypothetical protein
MPNREEEKTRSGLINWGNDAKGGAFLASLPNKKEAGKIFPASSLAPISDTILSN